MDLTEFKEQFTSDLDDGLDHAEWYEKEIKWLIEQAEKVERLEEDCAYWKMKWRDLVELDENDNVVAIVTPEFKVPIGKVEDIKPYIPPFKEWE